ncbi:MAG: HEAT repeat domain-containing protein [Candidatus Heimdallarchaeota archaeon]|nr:HEAT repeat domain-containing protein [Candidatus Heimdallarchaeota archaeon]
MSRSAIIIEYTKKHWKAIILMFSLILLVIHFFQVLLQFDPSSSRITLLLGFFSLVSVAGYSFFKFFTGPSRMEHEIKNMHGNLALSSFYRIYFPVVMFSFLLQIILIFNSENLIDPKISPYGNIFYIIPSIVTAVGLIAVSDHEIRSNKLSYSPSGATDRFSKAFLFSMPMIGLYFGIRYFTGFVLETLFGSGALYTSALNPYSVDSNLVFAAKVWPFLSNMEKILLLFGFILIYIAVEIFVRGYITALIRSLNLSMASVIFIPAIIQAAAFSSGMLLFSDPAFYVYRFIDALMFSAILGAILWKTKRFGVTLSIGMLIRIFDTSSEFFRVLMNSMPKIFGEYNVNDSITTTTENIASSIVYIQITLIILFPLTLIIGFDEMINITTKLITSIKKQWFGYLIIAISFIVIDIVFSWLIGDSIIFIGMIAGYIIALFFLRFILPAIFSLLPPVTGPMIIESQDGLFKRELPLNLHEDIKWLDEKEPWHKRSKLFGSIGASVFIYFLFVAAAYRQFFMLTGLDLIKFSVFLVILPTSLFALSSYLLVDRINKGYFFSENWRIQLYFLLVILLLYNLVMWTIASAITNFLWRNVPFFVFFGILIFPKPIANAFNSFAIGLSQEGRIATFRWATHDPTDFIPVIDKLNKVPSERINSGTYILSAKLGLLEEDDLMDELRNGNGRRGTIIGQLLALGIIGSTRAEGLLLQYISNDDLDYKIAAYWSLGKVGSTKALSRMAQILEENPRKELIKIAENAILQIDPMYPLAGLRDPVVMV